MFNSLVELLKFRDAVHSKMDAIASTDEINKKIQLLSILKDDFNGLQHISQIESTIQKLNLIKDQNKDIIDQFDLLIKSVERDIDQISSKITSDPKYQLKFSFNNDSFYHKKIPLTDETIDIITTRISVYASWKYPGICLYPKEKKHIDCMVACDPLYLVHPSFEQLEQLINDYHILFQRRLRLYQFDEEDVRPLPIGQAGMILCWDLFNFLTLDIIKDQLTKLNNWLRPGGIILANYNNCDLVETAKEVGFGELSYCTPRILKSFADQLGLEVNFFNYKNNEAMPPVYTSWVEFRKAGTLTSLRSHQPLAEIVKINL